MLGLLADACRVGVGGWENGWELDFKKLGQFIINNYVITIILYVSDIFLRLVISFFLLFL